MSADPLAPLPRFVPHRPTFILASGPSLTQEDADHAWQKQSIAVGRTLDMVLSADIHYSCDPAFWRTYADRYAPDQYHAGIMTVGLQHPAQPEWVRQIPYARAPGLGRTVVHEGHNSGYQAINLAYLLGARKICLLGFDMQPGPDGRTHWHEPHPHALGNFCPDMARLCIRAFDGLAADLQREGVEVINCSRATALTCFQRMTLAEYLARV